MNFGLRNLSIRSRIMIMLILISGISAAVLITIGYNSGKEGITEGIFNQLTGVRASKQYQIESYFDHMSGIVEILGHNDMIADALVEFKKGFGEISNNEINLQCHELLNTHYEKFVDKLSENLSIKPNIELFYPNSAAACYLQYEYIVDNPHPIGEKHQLIDARDNSYYTDVHTRYHNYLTEVILKFGFYDIFLVDLEKGDIVYTSYKETDYGTNLYSGPYRESNLALLVRQLRQDRDLNKAKIVDFASYRPSYGAPASFIGITVTEGSETIGALVLQLPVDEINKIMTGNNRWEEDGLGESGETYLVGEDHLMRSISRFYLEDTIGYKSALSKIGVDPEETERMYRLGTTILSQRVKTEGVDNALRGDIDTKIIEDYRGVPVLSSYSPLKMNGLNWAILSEIDVAEANKPIEKFKRKIFITLFSIILIVTFLSLYLAGQFVRPIDNLTEAVRKLKSGDYSSKVAVQGNDEFAELGTRFNEMVNELQGQQQKIQDQSVENEKLLLNFVPEVIARKLQNGEKNIAETHPNVSLIVVDVVGFSILSDKSSASDSIGLLNSLVDAFDTVAEKHHVEKIKTVGDMYFATCGLLTPRLDHAKRVLDFASELRQVIAQFNINHQTSLALQFGIHTGEVTAGIVGSSKFNFDLFGSTVNEAFRIKDLNQPNEILVSQSVYDKMKDMFDFKPSLSNQSMKTWSYQGKKIG